MPTAPERWLAEAIDLWKKETPDRFVDLPQWRNDPRWQTADERRAVSMLTGLQCKRKAVEASLNEEQVEAEAYLVAAAAAADAGRRRLLTEQGDGLASAVTEALQTLGFSVEDADAVTEMGTAKMEDLRLRDPDEPSWTNITEVKGYTGGGKTRDLQAIGRFATTYMHRTGAMPSSRWYVVNQFLGQDPDRRPTLLAGADEDVDVFALDGGVCIDTRGLFRLIDLVEGGALSCEQARRLLRDAQGRFDVPPG